MSLVTAYTDGGYSANRQLGSWAYLILENGEPTFRMCNVVSDTTNNRMEMLAAINAIKSVPVRHKIRIFSDSSYLVTGWNDSKYLKKWMSNGWRTSKGGIVENQDLWNELLQLAETHEFQFVLIPGHSKDHLSPHKRFNDMVDHMCSQAIKDGYGGIGNIEKVE